MVYFSAVVAQPQLTAGYRIDRVSGKDNAHFKPMADYNSPNKINARSKGHPLEQQQLLDSESLRRLRDRDSGFLADLFSEINPYLARFCLANNVSGMDVQELIHQSWDTFFSKLSQFEGRSQIRTYVCGILFNKIREWRRDRKKIVPEEDISKVLDQAFTLEGWWKSVPADPSRLAETKETVGFVRECLEDLSDQQATAFVMREVEEESSEDICKFLGIELSHLRVLIFRAKDKLRKCVEGKIASNKKAVPYEMS